MGWITLIVIAIGLSFDSFAVSVSSGIARNQILFREASVVAFSLAFFQGTMPVMGWFLGREVSQHIAEIDHWIAFGVLFFLGLKMVLSGIKQKERQKPVNPLKPAVLLSLSVATSIDAFIVGISFAFFHIRILLAGLIIGSVTFVVSMFGIFFGKNIGYRFGDKMVIVGGLILITIGAKILIEHLFLVSGN